MSDADRAPSGLIGEAEWRRLLAAAAHNRFPCRDRSLLHLFWTFGATVRQVLDLEPDHVGLLSGRLSWPDGREAVLTPEALRTLTAYMSLERHPRCPRLFCGPHGRPLSPGDIDRLFRRLSWSAGFPVDPRLLRRSALLRLLRAAPLRAFAMRPDRGAPPSSETAPGAASRAP